VLKKLSQAVLVKIVTNKTHTNANDETAAFFIVFIDSFLLLALNVIARPFLTDILLRHQFQNSSRRDADEDFHLHSAPPREVIFSCPLIMPDKRFIGGKAAFSALFPAAAL
jgi:hypothetical protein